MYINPTANDKRIEAAEKRLKQFAENLSNSLGFDLYKLQGLINPDQSKIVNVCPHVEKERITITIDTVDPKKLVMQFKGTAATAEDTGYTHVKRSAVGSGCYDSIDLSAARNQEDSFSFTKGSWEKLKTWGERVIVSPVTQEKNSFDGLADLVLQELKAAGFEAPIVSLQNGKNPYPTQNTDQAIVDILQEQGVDLSSYGVKVVNDDHLEIIVQKIGNDEKGGWSKADKVRPMSEDKTAMVRIARDCDGVIGIFVENQTEVKEIGQLMHGDVERVATRLLTGTWSQADTQFLLEQIKSFKPLEPSSNFQPH